MEYIQAVARNHRTLLKNWPLSVVYFRMSKVRTRDVFHTREARLGLRSSGLAYDFKTIFADGKYLAFDCRATREGESLVVCRGTANDVGSPQQSAVTNLDTFSLTSTHDCLVFKEAKVPGSFIVTKFSDGQI